MLTPNCKLASSSPPFWKLLIGFQPGEWWVWERGASDTPPISSEEDQNVKRQHSDLYWLLVVFLGCGNGGGEGEYHPSEKMLTHPTQKVSCVYKHWGRKLKFVNTRNLFVITHKSANVSTWDQTRKFLSRYLQMQDISILDSQGLVNTSPWNTMEKFPRGRSEWHLSAQITVEKRQSMCPHPTITWVIMKSGAAIGWTPVKIPYGSPQWAVHPDLACWRALDNSKACMLFFQLVLSNITFLSFKHIISYFLGLDSDKDCWMKYVHYITMYCIWWTT